MTDKYDEKILNAALMGRYGETSIVGEFDTIDDICAAVDFIFTACRLHILTAFHIPTLLLITTITQSGRPSRNPLLS